MYVCFVLYGTAENGLFIYLTGGYLCIKEFMKIVIHHKTVTEKIIEAQRNYKQLK